MAGWHPVDNLVPSTWVYRISGAAEPFAEIRYLPVLDADGFEVWRFRVVTWQVPRELIGDGYYSTLEAAAKACAHHHVVVSVPRILNTSPSHAGRGM
ncbi:hypothetical protein [Herbiconiux sp. YIM B11900]|uniref:hypothetical protein n=1 Tax=Herbiconiux sp. YIM B11900 TaxID=3404131 RepID=UPI003F85A86E